MVDVVLILSGGMDSATLAYWHKERGHECLALTFDYGQRHRRELQGAKAIAQELGYPQHVIRLESLGLLLPGSSLTDGAVDTPHGHYQERTMRQTVVPSRNAIMLSVAWGVAVANGADLVSFGAHAGDHVIYPDCREPFVDALEAALKLGSTWAEDGDTSPSIRILAPFLSMSKTDIARVGGGLGVPYQLTYTCYEGGPIHCGECGACQERREAFRESGVPDPTVYSGG
jgi:7-cyano-7-deazaguanine synthase